MELVGLVKNGKGRRPIKRIKIEDREMTVSIDTGYTTVNVMDEDTYRNKFCRDM